MNTKYSNWKMWYYVLCMVLTLQLAACSEEMHDEYTAAPEIEDTYIDQLDVLIAEMTDLQQNSDYGDKKGQYPTESRLNCLWTDVVMVVLISISDVAKNMSISEPKETKPLLLSFG